MRRQPNRMFHVLEENILKMTRNPASHKLHIIVVWGGGFQKGSTKPIVNNVLEGTLNLDDTLLFHKTYVSNVSISYFFRCHWRKLKNSRPEAPHRPQRILWGIKFALLKRMGMQLYHKGEILHKCNTYDNNIT